MVTYIHMDVCRSVCDCYTHKQPLDIERIAAGLTQFRITGNLAGMHGNNNQHWNPYKDQHTHIYKHTHIHSLRHPGATGSLLGL